LSCLTLPWGVVEQPFGVFGLSFFLCSGTCATEETKNFERKLKRNDRVAMEMRAYLRRCKIIIFNSLVIWPIVPAARLEGDDL
jgi:hypothetical protein